MSKNIPTSEDELYPLLRCLRLRFSKIDKQDVQDKVKTLPRIYERYYSPYEWKYATLLLKN